MRPQRFWFDRVLNYEYKRYPKKSPKKQQLPPAKWRAKKFYQPLRVTNKGYRDYVTDADLAAQEAITTIIRAAFPRSWLSN